MSFLSVSLLVCLLALCEEVQPVSSYSPSGLPVFGLSLNHWTAPAAFFISVLTPCVSWDPQSVEKTILPLFLPLHRWENVTARYSDTRLHLMSSVVRCTWSVDGRENQQNSFHILACEAVNSQNFSLEMFDKTRIEKRHLVGISGYVIKSGLPSSTWWMFERDN